MKIKLKVKKTKKQKKDWWMIKKCDKILILFLKKPIPLYLMGNFYYKIENDICQAILKIIKISFQKSYSNT